MLIKKVTDIKSSEITDEKIFRNRRNFILAASAATAGLAITACKKTPPPEAPTNTVTKLEGAIKSPLSTNEKMNSFEDASTYNNYYEFGTSKGDPAENAHTLVTRPWTVSIEGEANKPKTFSIEDLLKLIPLEERIYRFRCVEGWSMVVPWIGIPLGELLKRVEPNSNAKFVQFASLYDKKQMPLADNSGLTLPYTEGLRMDEAMHPLTILAVGMYGQILPNQNGAPIRLIVPWKYGFKGIKSIVTIRLIADQPRTTWNMMDSREYGFYSNVNPNVPHPRWSQATERRLPGLFKSTPTQIFNGYGDQVASLYNGMDLKKEF